MGRRLKKINDVRKYLADLINRTERGEVDPALAGRLGYLANILTGCIKDGDLERRLEQLEELVEKQEANR